MFLRGWRLLTLLLTALSAGMAYCHLLELSAKMKYSGSLYLMLHRTLYHEFGTVGGALEVAAAFATVVLTVLVRHRRGAFLLTLAAAVCLAAALAVFLEFVAPANSAMFRMPLQRPPVEWVRWRDQWEYSHAVRTALTVLGFALLLWSSLRETPTNPIAQPLLTKAPLSAIGDRSRSRLTGHPQGRSEAEEPFYESDCQVA